MIGEDVTLVLNMVVEFGVTFFLTCTIWGLLETRGRVKVLENEVKRLREYWYDTHLNAGTSEPIDNKEFRE
jgi:hypothetical protein